MEQQRGDNIRMSLQTITAIGVAVLLGINGWALQRLVTIQTQVAVNTAQLSAFMGDGPRYTSEDAEKDMGVLLRVLDSMDEDLDDLDQRVSRLESLNSSQ